MVSGHTWLSVPGKCRPLTCWHSSVLVIERGARYLHGVVAGLRVFLHAQSLFRTQSGEANGQSHLAARFTFAAFHLRSGAARLSCAGRAACPGAVWPITYGARWRWLRIACLLLAGTAHYAGAQPATNVEAYQRLALDCLADVPDTIHVFQLQAPPQMPYLRTALVDRWHREGRTVFLADSTLGTPPARLPRLVYLVEERGVDYERAGRRQMRRAVRLGLRYTLLGADGRLLREDACLDRFDDMLRPSDQPVVETAAFPESQGAAPRAGWLRRYAQPAVLAAATAVTIYLFFSLRNNQPEG